LFIYRRIELKRINERLLWQPLPLHGIFRAWKSCGPEAVMIFKRITVDHRQMGGVPCIRGLRIPVATVVGMIADGMAAEEILAAYPDLEREDIGEALRYAAEAVRERELPLSAK
jgi:uncharacterized protein (DUF433 family)